MDFRREGNNIESVNREHQINSELRIRNIWNRFHNSDDDRIVYGSWFLYTPKATENPVTIEDELRIVLEKFENQIVYNAKKSTHLKEEDYASFVMEWVLRRIKQFGIETADEINSFSLQLNGDMNRYRSEKGYAIKIPTQFFSDFNKVYDFIEVNDWMTEKDIKHLVDSIDLKYKTKKVENDKSKFFSFIKINIIDYKNNEKETKNNLLDEYGSIESIYKPLEVFEKKKRISEDEYFKCVATINAITEYKFSEKDVKNFVRKALSNKENNFNLKDTKIKMEILKNIDKDMPTKIDSFIYMYDKLREYESEPFKDENEQELLKHFYNLNVRISENDAVELCQGKRINQDFTSKLRAEVNKLKKEYKYEDNYILTKYNQIKVYDIIDEFYQYLKNIKKLECCNKEKTIKAEKISRIGFKSKDKYNVEYTVISYRSSNDVDVIAYDKNKEIHYLITGCKFHNVSVGRNLLMHHKYIEIDKELYDKISNISDKEENEIEDDYEID